MRTHSCADEERFPVSAVGPGPISVRPSTIAMVGGILLLITSWLFPPHQAVLNGVPMVDQSGAGLRYIFASQDVWSDQRTFALHWHLLLLIDLGILAASSAAAAVLRSAENAVIESTMECEWRRSSNLHRLRLQAFVLATGFALLALAWLFPPWTAVRGSVSLADQRGAGFHYAFRPQQVWSDQRTFVIDWRTLAIINLGVLLATAGGLVSIRSEEE